MQIYHHRSTKNLSLVFSLSFLLHTIHSSSTTHFGITSSEMWNEMKWDERKKRKKCKRKKKTFQIFFLSALILDSTAYCCCILMWMKKSFQLPQPYVLLSSSWLPPSLRHQIVCIFFTLSIWALPMLKMKICFASRHWQKKFCILPGKHIPYAGEMQRSVPVLMLIFM